MDVLDELLDRAGELYWSRRPDPRRPAETVVPLPYASTTTTKEMT